MIYNFSFSEWDSQFCHILLLLRAEEMEQKDWRDDGPEIYSAKVCIME